MRYPSEKYKSAGNAPLFVKSAFAIHCRARGFMLIEVVTALMILALVSSSVLLVIKRCVKATTDSTLKMRAFEVARENMEKLLLADSVYDTVEYGISQQYPEIEWETTIESFNEPSGARMWVRAICKAEYFDTDEQLQKVELTHWLTNLSRRDVLNMLNARERLLAEYLVNTIEEAAQYARVDPQTIQTWVGGGMPKTETGKFIKPWLDLYKDTNGKPNPQQRQVVSGGLPDFGAMPGSTSEKSSGSTQTGKGDLPGDTKGKGQVKLTPEMLKGTPFEYLIPMLFPDEKNK